MTAEDLRCLRLAHHIAGTETAEDTIFAIHQIEDIARRPLAVQNEELRIALMRSANALGLAHDEMQTAMNETPVRASDRCFRAAVDAHGEEMVARAALKAPR